MGNPKHLEWLLEGVESWNRRRREEPFAPDLSSFDLPLAFRDAGLLPGSDRRIQLQGANLENADMRLAGLRLADLAGANLKRTNLERANLERADLKGANLTLAKCVGANFWGVDLRTATLHASEFVGTDFRRVNVETLTDGAAKPQFTDLSTALNLSDSQLDVMNGDVGVILREGTERPEHWLDTPPATDQTSGVEPLPIELEVQTLGADAISEPDKTDGLSSNTVLVSQVRLLLQTAPMADLTANSLSIQIDHAVAAARREMGNNVTDEVLFFEDLSATIANLGRKAQEAVIHPDREADLLAEIEALKEQIDVLTNSPGHQTFFETMTHTAGAFAGSGLAISLMTGTGFLLGSYAPDTLRTLSEWISGNPAMTEFIPPRSRS